MRRRERRRQFENKVTKRKRFDARDLAFREPVKVRKMAGKKLEGKNWGKIDKYDSFSKKNKN